MATVLSITACGLYTPRSCRPTYLFQNLVFVGQDLTDQRFAHRDQQSIVKLAHDKAADKLPLACRASFLDTAIGTCHSILALIGAALDFMPILTFMPRAARLPTLKA